MKRWQMLERLQEPQRLWDLLIIGGGATGLGVAWNASAAGYRTALLERFDFAQGTSSRSTKLIHGGVRYLRQGQMGMVRGALHEREFLLQAARPLVWPLHLVIPSYHFGSRWFYYAGLKMYDYLAGKRNMQPARLLSAEETRRRLPTIQSHGLRGGVVFSDGQFDDAGLALAVAVTVAEDPECAVLNYARVLAIDGQSRPDCRVVRFRDETTGIESEIRARVVVNATGVFAEEVSLLEQQGGDVQNPIRISPSRGTHLVLPRTFLPSDHALMIPNTDDGRVLFAIPWMGQTLLGTTDVATESIDIEPQPSNAEIDYLLEHAGRYLTDAPKREDIQSTFSGLRPLIGKSSARSTAKLSREHEIVVSPGGMISIIGGKWTTFRKMGRDVLRQAIEIGKLEKRSFPDPSIRWQAMDPERFTDQELVPLDSRLPIRHSDIRLAVEHQMAEKLEDVLARRTRCLLLDAAASQEIATQVVDVMRQYNGRDAAWAQNQLQEFRQLAQHYQVD
jgi:glycerol-3-phosphate dehydrogenase